MQNKNRDIPTSALDDFYTYELSRTTFDGTKFHLTDAQLLSQRWPDVYKQIRVENKDKVNFQIITMLDQSSEYLVIEGDYAGSLSLSVSDRAASAAIYNFSSYNLAKKEVSCRII